MTHQDAKFIYGSNQSSKYYRCDDKPIQPMNTQGQGLGADIQSVRMGLYQTDFPCKTEIETEIIKCERNEDVIVQSWIISPFPDYPMLPTVTITVTGEIKHTN